MCLAFSRQLGVSDCHSAPFDTRVPSGTASPGVIEIHDDSSDEPDVEDPSGTE